MTSAFPAKRVRATPLRTLAMCSWAWVSNRRRSIHRSPWRGGTRWSSMLFESVLQTDGVEGDGQEARERERRRAGL